MNIGVIWENGGVKEGKEKNGILGFFDSFGEIFGGRKGLVSGL